MIALRRFNIDDVKVLEVIEGAFFDGYVGFFCLPNISAPFLTKSIKEFVKALVFKAELKNKSWLHIAKAISL